MAIKINEDKFSLKDKAYWWGSNLLGLIASIVLVGSMFVSLPFRKYRSITLRYIVRIISICLIVCILVGFYLYYIPHQSPDFGDKTKYIVVNRGETVYDISYKLYKIGAISSEFNFVLFSKIFGHSRKLKTGRYAIEPNASFADIFEILTTGSAIPYNVTIQEGLTVEKTAELLSGKLLFNKDDFIKACGSRTLLDSLSIPTDDLEGYLFPDTYNFFYDESPRQVVNKMLNHFFASIPDSFEAKAKRHGLDIYEAVIMASLIESEAMIDSERPMISAVYHKRLKIGMRLQCDPTVIYALGGLNRPLYRRDLKLDSPYNTYKYYGLPPGPICSPGKASLEAAVNPAAGDYLYFVAKGDGSHVFSKSNRDHINAKNRIKRAKKLGLKL
ncbi:MAG: endolytic transglycosylase MltG [candidate division Zixibacteria bacterium]|nr:endolytic transglycosylase MltG [candidate division Zixibacteria bacterium]